MILLLAACDSPTVPEKDSALELSELWASFDMVAQTVVFQVHVNSTGDMDAPAQVWVNVLIDGDSEMIDLVDDGTAGDLLANNGTYSRHWVPDTPLDTGEYYVDFYVEDTGGNIYTGGSTLVVEEPVAPQIIAVDMPQFFELHPTQYSWLNIEATVQDPNGVDDIRWLKYEINTDFMFKDNPETPECDREWGLTSLGYISDPTWKLLYLEPGSGEDTWQFGISIPMRPLSECGGTGDALFRFTTLDRAGLSAVYEEELLLGIFGCGDGFCTTGQEDAGSCAEDCGTGF